MCGIIGIVAKQSVTSQILESLKRLEYRGYDSCGIAVIGNKLEVRKNKGKIEEVAKKENFEKLAGNVGIGHTRWATHGKVNKRNAHPHLDCTKTIAIAHNGIIENYRELKRWLISKGHVFRSETDSEVIAHLVEEALKNSSSFFEACIKAIKLLEGAYAITIIYEKTKELVASRKHSPLVVGIGNEEIFVASDVPAFLPYTNRVVYLKDYDIVHIAPDLSYKIFNLKEMKFVERPVENISLSIKSVEKGDFDHYMIKEIYEQIGTVKLAVAQNKELFSKIAQEIKRANNVYLVGAGTSYHACLMASYYFAQIAKVKTTPLLASEFKNFKNVINRNDLIIAVSQSGETYDVLEAVRSVEAKKIGIINVRGSSLDREVNYSIYLNAGPEICVLATKTYTAQLSIFYLLAQALRNNFDEAKREVANLSQYLYELMAKTKREKIKEIARKLKNAEHLFIVGKGINYATALEAALKIKEVSYIHAEAFAGGELKHGTIALIEKNTPCIVIANKNDEIIENAEELKARGATIIGVAPKNYSVFDYWIKTPDIKNELLYSIINIVPMQLLAYELALLRNCDPDKPRNLAKSVTVK